MRWNTPTSIGKTIEVKAANRPLKIAYLVPFDDADQTHMNLDAVFFESYTRWAGVYTLIVPTKANEFMADEYIEWLKHYDPDFIYSYVELNANFIDKIDHLCCPIAFLKHKIKNPDNHAIRWRSFLPDWGRYIKPVSSITTVQTPVRRFSIPGQARPQEPTVFTQYGMEPTNRFLADNFGTGFDLYSITQEISGYFKTLCLVPESLPANNVAGSERCFSVLDAFRAISDHRALPIAQTAMSCCEGIPRIEPLGWSSAFRLFIGSTPLDRINFWNCRSMGNPWNASSNSLILEPELFDDEQLVVQLGQYLNKNNFLGHGNGPYQTSLHSSSVSNELLNSFKDKLQPHTWTSVSVSRSFNSNVIPTEQDLSQPSYKGSSDTVTLRLTEDSSEIEAIEPVHFMYIPPQFRDMMNGQWIVELNIQRHNNLSKFSNVVDTWSLPRYRKITHAFTNRLSKPTINGYLAVIPAADHIPLGINAGRRHHTYEIYLPSDEMFFRHLALEHFRYGEDDLRSLIQRNGYQTMATSDKGQNLRGVISMFDNLSTAFNILTNKYWRNVLAEAKEDSTRPLAFSIDKLNSMIPNDDKSIQSLTKALHFDNIGKTKSYLRDNLKDTLEFLVRRNVFYQTAHWRCEYCGHENSRSFDNIKVKNECDICSTLHYVPIDIDWFYELNDFVHRSLQKHSGLPVLWTLGFLQDRLFSGAFWYLPEVDLYRRESDDSHIKNEIDILCIVDRLFYAIEVKRSATLLLNKEGAIDKFVKVIELLRPDIALLSFERYCTDEADEYSTKERLTDVAKDIRTRIGPWTKLEILVAQDVQGFDDFPVDLGLDGKRTFKYYNQ